MKQYILLLLSFLGTLPALAERVWQSKHTSMHINMHEGLPHNHVDDIVKDSRGFIWIATGGGGLTRYDGYECLTFNQYSSAYPLKHNTVRSICEDDFSRLWVASSEGVEVINIHSLKPSPLKGGVPAWDSLCVKGCYRIVHIPSNQLWINNDEGLFRARLDEQGERVTEVDTILLLPKGNAAPIVSLATSTHQKDMWIGCGNNIYLQRGTHAESDTTDIRKVYSLYAGNCITALKEWRGHLWVGTHWGLFKYNLSTGTRSEYHTHQQNNALSQDYITDLTLLASDADTCLIVSTLKGFNVYRPETDDFERITCENFSAGRFPLLNCNFINCMMADGRRLWVGTEAGGVNIIEPRKLFVSNFTNGSLHKNGAAPNPTNAIYEDCDGTIWVGTVEGGLYKLNPKTFQMEEQANSARDLSHNSVSCITADGENRLWIGTWGGGICIGSNPLCLSQFAPQRFTHLLSAEYADLNWSQIRSLCYDSINHYMWTATGHSVYAYDFFNKRFITPLAQYGVGGMLVGNAGSCIDASGNMWMNTTSGLCCISLNRMKEGASYVHLWQTILGDLDMTKTKTTFITTSHDNTVWIGTDGHGVIHITKVGDDWQFHKLTTAEGLIDNHVRGVLEDNQGFIWISTLKGMSAYNPEYRTFVNYTAADGFTDSPFYVNAAYKSAGGTLYFGTMQGVSAISPQSQPEMTKDKEGRIVFTQAYTPEQNFSLQKGKLSFHEKEKTVTIHFAMLDYATQAGETYTYRLHGFDNKLVWMHATDRKATYTNLSPGDYTLEVRYAAGGRHWQEATARLEIEILPHFYKTSWFKFLTVIALILVIYASYSWRVRNLKRQKKELNRQIKAHTMTLSVQKEELAQRARELEHKNRMLTEQNNEITRQKGEILQMAQQQFAYSMSPEELHIPAESPDAELLNRTLAIIKENYSNPEFDVNDIISAMGVSRTLLYTKVQKLTGSSVGTLLRNYRLTMAHRLIAEALPTQSLTIAEIAYRVGFNDPKYFSRCFAKQFGCPPSKIVDGNAG